MPARSIGAGLLFLLCAACSEQAAPEDSGPSPALDAGVFAARDGGPAPMDGGSAARDAGAPSPDAGPGPLDAGPPARVLFVGNSYTYVNDLPEVVATLGRATPGAQVLVEAVTQGGARFADHWASTGARARIEAGDLDAVVLQAQSVEPVFGSESFHYYAEQLAGVVQAVDARPVWFSTWARRAGHEIYEGGYTPEQMAEDLEFRYRSVARLHGGRVARVGAAWQIAGAEMPQVQLHSADGSHPSEAGSLLAACVILQAITGLAPEVPTPAPLGLDSTTAEALCAIAPRVICPEGSAFCDGDCRQTSTDPLHCGGCNVACAVGDPCRDGVCGCADGLTGCNRICYDLSSSVSHCGVCDSACGDGEICTLGQCGCASAQSERVTLEQLRMHEPACATWEDSGSPACNAAAHARCSARACFDSGFGPASGHAPRPEALGCVAGEVVSTSTSALGALGCDPAAPDQRCATAIHDLCRGRGAVSGFGPWPAAGGLELTCVRTATVVQVLRSDLQGFASRCTPDPVRCSAAAWNLCESRGYPGGFGPVRVDGDLATVTCVQ